MPESLPLLDRPSRPRSRKSSPPARAVPAFGVVGIGASAGGLEACIKLVAALPTDSGMAFILIQHLEPNHKSLMVELLAGHTSMPVLQATSGMLLQPDRLHIIPPGPYLSVSKACLMLSAPRARHGARMPFDFLLTSLAEEFGPRTMCVILSGTGDDGSLGLRAIKQAGGLVIAQDPDEAAYDGMPRSAIGTGVVDLVLRAEAIPQALLAFDSGMAAGSIARPPGPEGPALPAIIELLRTKTSHDFTLYKHGTLQRRIERRMSMSGIAPGQMEHYFDRLRLDVPELDLLARDLLINVTSFFRDPRIFDVLERTTIPDLIRRQAPHQALRIWVAGCSTGQETYSIAMLFREQLVALKSTAKLQIFASDVDPEAVAAAREGCYPASIEAEVSSERLARFFTREDDGYRVQPELRAAVVFAVQDVLADPPFSRLDMVSCRNLLIYLKLEAQRQVISMFHFALREGGLLLLGSAETVNLTDGRFESVSKSDRLYRRVGHNRSTSAGFSGGPGESLRVPHIQEPGAGAARRTSLADLGRRLVLECFAPAAILINRNLECLYSLGPTDRYLRVAPGHHTHDLLAMARPGIRAKLQSAIRQAHEEKTRIVVAGGRMRLDGRSVSFRLDVQPVLSAGEDLLLVCFVDEGGRDPIRPSASAGQTVLPTQIEQELDAARADLHGALRELETSTEEHKAINEEALSVNEEYQSTNEELLTSKEELQSLNEELTALNSQLQETLERQRTTSDDLQNVLYSTDVATLFLDLSLRIRFFTPASKALFNIIAGDVGRPLADLHSLASDNALSADADTVLKTLLPIEREIETSGDIWFTRRILPYRAHDKRVEGVVITFTDITERKLAAKAVNVARQDAEMANLAKSRFLAAASHDLRQPLQTLTLLQGLLERNAESDKVKRLVARQGDTLVAMVGMLNTLLDVNQIEAGVVRAEVIAFPIDEMLIRLRDEFTYHAQAQGLALRMVPCSLVVMSDPRLLEQMLRNLLTNALKYTSQGRVVLGCRRHGGMVRVEIWDTGIGIPDHQLRAIFDEYHQLDNPARERSRGLGLGLSIVQRLGRVLGHPVSVRSRRHHGSVFSIDLPRAAEAAAGPPDPGSVDDVSGRVPAGRRIGMILVVEDDPDVREVLQLFLQDEGHLAATTRDGHAARELVTRGAVRPDLIIADYNLPDGLDGVQLALRLRESAGSAIPVVILTGDSSDATSRSIAEHDFVRLTKPVLLEQLTGVLQTLLPGSPAADRPKPVPPDGLPGAPLIFVVDDDADICEATRSLLEDDGLDVQTFASGEAFLAAYCPGPSQCLLIDAYLPGMTGIELLRRLTEAGHKLPAIVMTGQSDVPMAVQAMKAGAVDFIEKPIGSADLLAGIHRTLERAQNSGKRLAWQRGAAELLSGLTLRQSEIMARVLAGQHSKNIAADLEISQRTVENHRAAIMRRTGATSLPALARLALAATWNQTNDPMREASQTH